MKPIFLVFIISILLGSCCTIIKPEGDNKSLFIKIIKSDDISNDPEHCDGDIIIESPSLSDDVTFKWSHDPNLKERQANQLCSGLYKITITKGIRTRVSQVIIN